MLAHLAHPTCYSKLHFEFELADCCPGWSGNYALHHAMILTRWGFGRVVDCTGLENRHAERHPGFESLSPRQK